jgi:hypothetical protein
MLDRGARLAQFRFAWPALTAAMLATAMHWLMAMLIVAALMWYVAKRWPLKFPLGQGPSRDSLGTQVHVLGKGLETETGGEI